MGDSCFTIMLQGQRRTDDHEEWLDKNLEGRGYVKMLIRNYPAQKDPDTEELGQDSQSHGQESK